MTRSAFSLLGAIAASLLLASCASRVVVPPAGIEKIQTVVVFYAENRSFDHLFGRFPGAEGIDAATAEQKTQIDRDGTPLPRLPAAYWNFKVQPEFPASMPNGPFALDAPPVNLSQDFVTPDPTHSWYQHIAQINGGRNNAFVRITNVGALAMGYYDGSRTHLWNWAKQYTLADHFFQGTYGGSYVNHQWLVCACLHAHPDAADNLRSVLDENGELKHAENSPKSALDGPPRWVRSGTVMPKDKGSYAINTVESSYQPSGILPPADDFTRADPARSPLPPLATRTIGDTLTEKGVRWAWYSQGWKAANADGMRDPKEKRTVIKAKPINFAPHHSPFNYYQRFAPGSADRETHLKDRDDFLRDIESGTLPQVVFYKPAGSWAQHSWDSSVTAGDVEIHDIVSRLVASPQWPHMAIIVTYDEYGGYWDHVPPPMGPGWGDAFGPGSRIPAVIISPYAKRGFVDKTVYDTTSIQKFLNRRFGLAPLPGLRENMGDLTAAFAF
ncbi:MAG: acid phosphatase [Betaproteobacteria bacterium]|nr:acid phosphatase [Betaproteobacteria bacterium]